jgi:hypothetical protein
MEKRVMGIIWRLCVALIAFSFTAIAVKAQNVLTNPGFETAGTNYTFPDNGDSAFPIISNTFAASWTPNGLYVARTVTNGPQAGTYEDAATGYDYVGINNSGSATTARNGVASLRTFGPFPATCCTGSGAVQMISSNQNAAVSNNTVWVVSGYGLNWSGDPLADVGLAGTTGFGTLQVAFYDVTNALIGTATDSQHLDTNTVVDVWTNVSASAIAPPGTVSVAAWALHVGMSGALGSVFWDDITLTNAGTGAPPPPIVTNQFQAVILKGNQVCFATSSNASYQAQSSDDGSTWTNVNLLTPGDGLTDCVFAVTHKFYRVQISQ